MNLRIKTLIFVIVFDTALTFGLSWFIWNHQIINFERLEKEDVARDLVAVKAGLNLQIENLFIKTADWSSWDDTYKYVTDKNKAYEKSNLLATSFNLLKIDGVVYFDKEGRLVKKVYYDQKLDKLVDFSSGLVSLEKFPGKNILDKGLALDTNGLMYLYAARPILKSDGTGPENGEIVFFKYYQKSDLEDLKKLSGKEVFFDFGSKFETYGPKIIDGKISDSELIKDKTGEVVGRLGLLEDRELFNLGIKDTTRMIYGLVGFGLVMTIFTYMFIYYLVVLRLKMTAEEVNKITNQDSNNIRIKVVGKDEISFLVGQFNRLLDKKQSLEEQLKDEKNRIEEYMADIPVMVLIYSESGDLEFANKNAYERVGSEELLLKSIKDIDKDGDNKITLRDGRVLTVNWVVRNIGGKKIYVGNDVTEMRMFEVDKEERIRQLELINQSMVDREAKMAKMKNRIFELEKAVEKNNERSGVKS